MKIGGFPMGENDKNYEAYEQIIAENCKNESNLPIPNSTMYHAFIGLKYLINKANKNIRIVSECFYEDFWKDLYPFIVNFLGKPESFLDVIIIKEYNEKGIIKKLKTQFPNNIFFFKFQEKELETKTPNFVTIDQKGYRFELSDEKKKDRLVEGVINFGDAEGTAVLNSLFDKVKTEKSVQITLA